MITWHVLFLTMILSQIGVQARKQGCGESCFLHWPALYSSSWTARKSRSDTSPCPASLTPSYF
jgi:hypothetical protein